MQALVEIKMELIVVGNDDKECWEEGKKAARSLVKHGTGSLFGRKYVGEDAVVSSMTVALTNGDVWIMGDAGGKMEKPEALYLGNRNDSESMAAKMEAEALAN